MEKLHMQEVKISLQIGEITHEIGEKKTLLDPHGNTVGIIMIASIYSSYFL